MDAAATSDGFDRSPPLCPYLQLHGQLAHGGDDLVGSGDVDLHEVSGAACCCDGAAVRVANPGLSCFPKCKLGLYQLQTLLIPVLIVSTLLPALPALPTAGAGARHQAGC